MADAADHAIDAMSDAALAADLRALSASLDVGVAQVDYKTRRHLSVNDAFVAMVGRSREELLAMTTDALLHPDDGAIRNDLYAAIIRDGSAAREARLVRGDGSDICVRVHSALVTDGDGDVRRIINLIYDLTERRADEARMRDNEERTSLALGFAGAGTWEYVIGTGEMIWSPETFALYELDPSQPAPRRREWTKFVHPDDIDAITREHADALTGGSIGADFRIRRKDGGWRWIGTRAQVMFDAAGQPQRVVGINIDLTEIKQAEAEKAAAAARWRAAVEATQGIVWTNTADGQMAGEQPNWSALTGQTREQYQGYGWASAVHPDDAQPTIDAWNAAVAARAPFHFEHRVRRADGEWRTFAIRALPVFDADGEIAEWVGVHNDVTEARDAQRLLAERVAKATAERNRAWDNSRDIQFILSDKGVITAVNRAWTDILGWPLDATVGRHYSDFVAVDVPGVPPKSGIRPGHVPPEFTTVYRHIDGSTRDIGWRVQVEADATYAIGRDVTEANRYAAELARARAERDSAWENASDILLILTPDGVITAANPAWQATLGWSVAEGIGHHYSDFVIVDVPGVAPGQPVLLDGQQLAHFENQYRCKDGGVRTISWRTRIDDGMLYASGRDLTDDKRRQAELAQARAERDSAWNNSRDLMAVIGADGCISAANPAWTSILGWQPEELIGRFHLTLNHPDDQAPSDNVLHEARETAIPSYECRVVHKDGTYRCISWVLASPDGKDTFINGRDVTQENARKAELERAQEQIHEMQKLETIGQLTGGVAHDFNNLLTPIIGSLDMIQRRMGDAADDRTKRLIDGALTAADRAKTLVQRLLAFARRQQLQTKAVDLIALVAGMRELIERSIGPSIAVKIVHEETLPPVRVDPAQLELALLNLAINARDAMEHGGRLTIAMARGHASGRGQLEKGDYVRLAVVDTGLGMDATTLRRAVEPFFSTKGIGRGTGLGLSMVHGLAAQFGGRLTLASAPQHGTRAELWLPVASDEVAELAAPEPEAAPMERRERVLLVDDEQLVREATAEMLADLGLDVTEADGPAAALALIADGVRFDALVTDYLMPGMNGGELIVAARARQPGLPALVITGYADVDGLPPELPRLGKPFRQAEMAKAVAGLLEAR